jgi:hypothetical protein
VTPRSSLFLSAVVCAAVAIACGGQVVFEEQNDGGAGGSGTTGPGGTKATTGTKNTTTTTTGQMTSQVATTNNQSSVGSMTSGGCSVPVPPPMDCLQACGILYACGQTFCGGSEQLCPAFTPNNVSQDEFLMGCVGQCQGQMALISIINPNDCDETIDTLTAVAAQFEQLCKIGF